MEALRTTDEKIEYLREEVKKLSSSVKNVHEEYNKITQFEKELHKLREMEQLRDIKHSIDIHREFIACLRHIGLSLFRGGLIYSRDCFIVIMLVAIMAKNGGRVDKVVKQDLMPEEHSSTNLVPINIGPKLRTLADSFGEAILKYLG